MWPAAGCYTATSPARLGGWWLEVIRGGGGGSGGGGGGSGDVAVAVGPVKSTRNIGS